MKTTAKTTKPEIITKKSSVRSPLDVYAPPVRLLVKLGSIAVHIDEIAEGGGGHHLDWVAIRSLLADREVQDWVEAMGRLGLMPRKRGEAKRGRTK